MKDGKTYGFTNEDVTRLKRALGWVERRYQNESPQRPKWPVPGVGLLPARTNGSTVAAGTIAAPASFSGTLMVPSGNGFTATGGESLTMYNPYTSTIAANTLIWVSSFNNKLYVVAANC